MHTKIKIALIICVLAFAGTAAAEPIDVVERFANHLIAIVSSANKDEFSKIPCMKIECGDLGVQYVFGEGQIVTSYERLLTNNEIKYKILGPYTVEPEYENSSYTIVFYLNSKSPFNPNGVIDSDYGFEEMNKSFLQTQVTVVNDLVYFQRVPFYIEAHHPYAGDY